MSQHAELIARLKASCHNSQIELIQETIATLQAMKRKPMTDEEIIEIGNEMHRAMPIGSDDQDELLAIVRAIEAFHGIQPPNVKG